METLIFNKICIFLRKWDYWNMIKTKCYVRSGRQLDVRWRRRRARRILDLSRHRARLRARLTADTSLPCHSAIFRKLHCSFIGVWHHPFCFSLVSNY